VTNANDDSFTSIERTQAALRDSIEKAKALAEESERRIRRPRDEPRDEAPEERPSNPA
jgi:hypothetical protein